VSGTTAPRHFQCKKCTFDGLSQQHLKRYLAEFDFRYNERMKLGVNDKTRATKAIKGTVGKRLTYQQPDEIAQALNGWQNSSEATTVFSNRRR
jgi:hypothetical protein